MEPVLISIDNGSITKEKDTLNSYVPYLQAAYDAFAAQNITVTIQDLLAFKQWTEIGNSPNFLENFVNGQLVDRAVPAASFNGVQIQREKLKDLVVMPDLSQIKVALKNLATQVSSYNRLNIRVNLLSLNNNVIAKVADADAQLTAMFTYYTKTDLSAQLATDLLAVGQLLEAAKGKYNVLAIDITAPNGLVSKDDGFGLDLKVIRAFESAMSN